MNRPATEDEVRAASLQFVRKLPASPNPRRRTRAAFNRAVDDVTAVARELMNSLVTTAPPHDRDVWIAKARARAKERYAKTS